MSDKLENTPRSSTRYVVWAIALLILYPLSIGPFVAVMTRFVDSEWFSIADEMYEFVYWPILKACEQSATLSEVVGLYLNLWIPPFIESKHAP